MTEQPLLSIVIASYSVDMLKDILELLDSIGDQTYHHTESILVIERSTELFDRIKQYAEEKAIPNLKVVFNHGETGLSTARNLGVTEARGDIIAFVDDDALLFPDWAEEMVKTYEDNSVIGVTGTAFPLWEDESMHWFPEEFYWIFSCTAWCDLKKLQEARNVWGMSMSFRKEAFEQCGLFATTFGLREGKGAVAEENELSMRVRRETGKRLIFNPQVRIRHRVYRHRLTWNFIVRRSYHIGRSRHLLKKLGSWDDKNTFSLEVENQLLKRIFSRLLPTILKNSFKHPLIAWRKFSVTFVVLSSVALGYFLSLSVSVRNRL